MNDFGPLGNTRVLIVDDQKEIHDDFREMLVGGDDDLLSEELAQTFGVSSDETVLPAFELLHAGNGEDGFEIVRSARVRGEPIAAAYVDVRMPPGIDGVEAVRRIRQFDREVEIVIMTAYTDKPLSEVIDNMDLLHKLLYVRKPFAREEIQQMTLSLVAKWNVEREAAAGRRRLEAVLDATGDGIAMYDPGGRLDFANRWYERLLDVSTDELQALPRDAAMARFTERHRGAARPPQAGGRFPANGKGSVVELAGSAGGRSSKPLLYRSTQPVNGDDGSILGDVVVYRDVSKEIEVEQMKIEVQRLRSELETTYSVEGIVGASPGVRKMCALVKQAAASDISVLIRGASGTGKEHVARALHFTGPRRHGPFRALDCAAVPETLIESELFGHERGAFPGATARRTGCFEEADGGTLLLDEIGDVPLALQPRLLQALQEREIRRVGGTTTVPVDVRIVAVTSRDLEAAVRAGRFREDLFCRLAVFPILVPPLRTRPDDLPLLAEHFVRKHAARLKKPVRGISAGAIRLLARHAWPGNVRELENVICRALVIETTDVLQAESFPPELVTADAARAAAERPALMTLATLEQQAIRTAVDAAGGNLTQAAQTLGIDRVTLYRKLKRYDRAGGRTRAAART